MIDKTINILIAESDLDLREQLIKKLSFKGYCLEGAETSEKALSLIKEQAFSIIFIDLNLGDKEGLEILKAIDDINSDAIVIVIVKDDSMDLAFKAMNQGVYFFITRSTDTEQLHGVIERTLAKQWLLLVNRELLDNIKHSNERLKELDRIKSAFVSNVSHEFRSPLATVKEAMSIVLDGLVGKINPEQRKILERGKATIERLIRLVRDLLDLSKIEAGRMEMRRSRVNMPLLIEEILSVYKGQIARKHIRLTKDIPRNIGLFWADRDKLIEVIINLLSNAIKYTPEKGSIDITAMDIGNEVCCEIYNSGEGIEKKNLKKVFNKFERITDRQEEGSGLGLAIAKDIIELHKGRIWAESQLGKGCKFVFTVPKDLREIPRNDK